MVASVIVAGGTQPKLVYDGVERNLPQSGEFRGGFEYTRLWSSFAPEVTDSYVAGGALDQYVALRLGAAYVY